MIYDETFGNIFQFLGYILAQAAQIAAAFAGLTGAENLFTAWRSWGQWLALWFLLWLWGRGFLRGGSVRTAAVSTSSWSYKLSWSAESAFDPNLYR